MVETVESTSDEFSGNNVMRHRYGVLTDVEKANMKAIRDIGLHFHDHIESIVQSSGGSRELSIAKTKIEEAVMWGVKHITSRAART